MTTESQDINTTPARGWVVFLVLIVVMALGAPLSFSFGVALPDIKRDLNLSPAQAGLVAGVFFAASTILAIPFSGIFSRFRPRRLVLVSLALAAPFIFLQGIAQSFAVLFAARALFVVCQTIKLPARVSVMQQWLAPRQFALANGISFALSSLVLSTSIISTAPLMQALGGWRNTYHFFGALFLVGFALWLAFGHERQGAEYARKLGPQGGTPFLAMLAYPQMWIVGAAYFAAATSWGALLTFLPTFFVEERGMSLSLAGLVVGLVYMWTIPSSLLVGPIYARVGRRKPLIWVPGVYFLTTILVVFLAPVKGVLVVMTGSLGLVWIMVPVVQTIPFEIPGIKPREVAVLTGMMGTMASGGFALGPVVTGFLIGTTGSVKAALLPVSVLCAFVVILCGFLTPEVAKGRSATGPGS